MLNLKLATDPRWVTIAESNLEEILTDHAWCEQKAATNAKERRACAPARWLSLPSTALAPWAADFQD